jgi:ABC-type lipoprotein export system ATPase subunit
MIRLHGVSKTYGAGVVALRDINMAVETGEFVAVMGPSGSGKSTLLHIIGALDRCSTGMVKINGSHIDSADTMNRVRRDVVGFVFQSHNLIPSLTATENVELPLLPMGIPPAQRRALAVRLLEKVGLSHRIRHFPSQLSGGESQRVAIARALVKRSSIIVADEPTGELDSDTANQITALLAEQACSGISVVMATHNPAIASCADRIVTMKDGCIGNP